MWFLPICIGAGQSIVSDVSQRDRAPSTTRRLPCRLFVCSFSPYCCRWPWAAQQPMLSLDFETGSLSEASTTGEAETSAWTISNWPLLAVAAMATPVVQEAESGSILTISYESGGSTTDLFVQPGEFLVFEQGAAQDDIKEDVLAELENGDVRQELPFPQWVHFSYRSASEPPPLKSAKEPSLEAVPEVLRDLENKLPGTCSCLPCCEQPLARLLLFLTPFSSGCDQSPFKMRNQSSRKKGSRFWWRTWLE